MNTETFNQNYELDRKTRSGVRANPKHATATTVPEVITADGKPFDSTVTYYFFHEHSTEIRTAVGLRLDGEHLCVLSFRVIPVAKLREDRDCALTDGQTFFKSEIERFKKRIKDFALEKSGESHSLKTF